APPETRMIAWSLGKSPGPCREASAAGHDSDVGGYDGAMGVSPEASLVELFTSLFTAEELRHWVQFAFGPTITVSLPGPRASLAALSFELADALARHGLVNEKLFE